MLKQNILHLKLPIELRWSNLSLKLAKPIQAIHSFSPGDLELGYRDTPVHIVQQQEGTMKAWDCWREAASRQWEKDNEAPNKEPRGEKDKEVCLGFRMSFNFLLLGPFWSPSGPPFFVSWVPSTFLYLSVSRREEFNPNWLEEKRELFLISEQFGLYAASDSTCSRPQATQLLLEISALLLLEISPFPVSSSLAELPPSSLADSPFVFTRQRTESPQLLHLLSVTKVKRFSGLQVKA